MIAKTWVEFKIGCNSRRSEINFTHKYLFHDKAKQTKCENGKKLKCEKIDDFDRLN